jgi:hypothetical protein
MLMTLAIMTSCGGRVERSRATDLPSPRPPSSGDSTPVVNGGADPGAPPAKPDPAPPSPVLRCSFKEGSWLINASGIGPGDPRVEIDVRTEPTGEVVLYLLARKYHLASENPCVLESEDGVVPGGYASPLGSLALGDDGRVWRSASNTLRRSSPLPSLKCTIGSGYIDDDVASYDVGPLFLDLGGKTGWGLDGPPGMLGRLTLGSDACSVELTKSPWGDLPVRPNTPRDASGRLHVLNAPTPGGIGIFTSTGTLVKAYAGKASASDPAPFDVTRCAGGVCVLGSDASGTSLLYLDDDGNPRAPALPLIKGLRVSHIAAAASGHVFIGGATDASLEPQYEVVIQMAPPPP